MLSPLFLAIAFIAGLLTVLAPCILPLLPVIIGGSVSGGANFKRALTIVVSLAASIVLFTLILKASTAFIAVPPIFWQLLSGTLLVLFGLVTAFPSLWERLGFTALLNLKGNRMMASGEKRKGFFGDVIVGIALGPVFSSCSPTYFIVLATILPAHPIEGFVYLVSYAVGLALALLLIAFVGQRLVDSLGLASDPRGWFKRSIGILFIIVGLLVTFGVDKLVAASLPSGAYGITALEQKLLEVTHGAGGGTLSPSLGIQGTLQATSTASTGSDTVTRPVPATKALRYPKAPELVAPDAYLNTNGQPISIEQFKGKKVVLIDFWTYSCINCQRTLPYLKAWNEKYKDQGLVIIGVHTPEFSFEHVASNVTDALARFGITYPVVLDNEYKTWNAFQNQYWPHKYLIDIDGFVVYDHAGEGNYDETEKAIQQALQERATALGESKAAVTNSIVTPQTAPGFVGSPETYFGASRNEFLANGKVGAPTMQTLSLPSSFSLNKLYLGGVWNFGLEKAVASDGADVVYTYHAKEVYVVASSDTPVTVDVTQDSAPVGNARGADVSPQGVVTIHESRLYKIISNQGSEQHTLKLHVKGGRVTFFTFTFG